MKIRTKLTIGASFTITAMFLIVVFCLNISREMYKEFELLKEDIIPGAIAMSQMEGMCQQTAHYLMDFMAVEVAAAEATVITTLESLEKAGDNHLQHECHIGDEEKITAKELMAKIHRFDSECRNIIDLKKQGLSTAELLKIADKNIHPALADLVGRLKAHKAVHMEELAASEQAVHKAYYSGTRIALLLSAFVAFLAIIFAFLMTRSIIKSLGLLVGTTEKIGSGNLETSIEVHSNDEIGVLAKSFGNMLSRLKETTASRDDLNKEITERKQIEEKLQKSKDRFDQLAEQNSTTAWEVDASGLYTYVSHVVEKVLGYQPEELVGQKYFYDLHPEEGREEFKSAARAVFKQKEEFVGIENSIKTKDGHILIVSTNGFPLIDADGTLKGYRGSDTDITERKRAENEQKKSEKKFRTLFDSSSDAVMLLNDKRFFDCNEATVKMFGCKDKAEFCTKHPADLSPSNQPDGSDSMTLASKQIETAIKEGSNRFEWVHQRINGDDFVADVSLNTLELDGQPVLQAVVRNITERKQAEEERLTALNFQQKILETAATAVFTVDSEKIITNVNRELLDITGFNEDELIGKHCDILKGDPCMKQCGLYNPDRKEPIFRSQCFIQTKDGKRVTIIKNADITYDNDGNITGGIESFVDITELVEAREYAEETSKQLKIAMRRANEMAVSAEMANAAKSEFLANMSHEIRTPMNGIIGMTELTLDTDLTEEQNENLEIVKSSAHNLLEIINDILDFSKVEAGKMKLELIEFDLRKTIDGALDPLTLKSHDKGFELISFVDPLIPEKVIGDPVKLRQIIVNLVGNSIKFTNEGQIVLRVELESEKNSTMFHFSVSDTGIGIPKDKQKSIFASFTQADGSTTRNYGGTGLGTTISKQLVELMEGKIWVESPTNDTDIGGVGSTFHFIVKFGSIENQQSQASIGSTSLTGKRVLIVETNELNRKYLRTLFENWDLIPVTANCGKKGLRLIQEANAQKEAYDIIMLETSMTDINGYDFLSKMNNENLMNDSKVIMLCYARRSGDTARAKYLGAAGFLSKPIKQDKLYNLLLKLYSSHSNGKIDFEESESSAKKKDGNYSLNILLVEDNKVNQLLALKLLNKKGHTVDTALDGKEAVDKVKSNKYDVVFMDVQMPVMNGYKATRSIRKWEKRTKAEHNTIIAMTANAMDGDKEKCLEAGMDNYVAKPINPKKLYGLLDELSDKGITQSEEPSTERIEMNNNIFDLKSVLERMDGDEEFLRELIGIYLEETPKTLKLLRDSIDKNETSDIQRHAHTIKGSSANIGGVRIQEAALEMEMSAKDNSLENIEDKYKAVSDCFEELHKYLSENKLTDSTAKVT